MISAYNTKYKLFQISWVILMLGIICDLTLLENIRIAMFKVNVQTSSIGLIIYIITFLIIIPVKEIINSISDKSNLIYFIICFVLLLVAFISSYASEMPSYAIGVTLFRYTILFLCFICSVVYCSYFKDAKRFIFFSFIYFNVLVITSSLADFYIPSFNQLLINKFGHMAAMDSNLMIRGIIYSRPSGLITDTNLTAFTIALSCVLLLLNQKEFKNKFFVYSFYLSAGYCFGMLASRSALISILFTAVLFWIFKFAGRKNVLVFLLLFFLVQLLTPQTQARLNQFLNKAYIEEEIGEGRPIIWRAAILAFSSSPVIGIGSGVFFKQSVMLIDRVKTGLGIYDQQESDIMEKLKHKGGINPHSIFLAMLAEHGITGIVIFLALLIFYIKELFRRRLYISLIILGVILFVSSLSNYAPYYKYYLMLCIIFYIMSKSNMRVDNDRNVASPGKIKNILIIKICCLGDVVFITPLLSALRKKYPDAKICLVSADWVKNIFPYLYGVDETIIFNSPLDKNFISRLTGTIKMILKIRKMKIDLALTTHRANIFGLLLYLSGIKYRLGFTGTKYLNHTAKFDDTIHETKRYLEILKSIGINADEPAVLVQKKNKSELRKDINISENDFLISIFPFGGVNPGTNMVIKRWEPAKYYELIKKLRQYDPVVKILVFEGTLTGENIDSAMLPGGVMVNKIKDDILSVSNIFVSGDTGSLHIAAAFGASTLALFGPSSPDHLAPLNYEGAASINRYIWKKPYCSPCYTPVTSVQKNNAKFWKGDTFICNTGTHECIKEISAEEVFETLVDMIQKLKIKNRQ